MELTAQLPVSDAGYQQPISPSSWATATQTQLAAISTSRSMDLNLVTTEGDQVTLSLDAQAAALYARSTSVTVGEDGDYLYRDTELAAGQYQVDFSLSIEGDLNDAEMREIRKVIKTLNKMMGQLANGNTLPEASTVGKLSGLDTIATMDASLSYERQVLVAQQSEVVVYNNSGELTQTPTGTLTPSDSNQPVKALAEEMARHFKKAKAPWAHKRHAVEHLFQRHRRQAASKAEDQQAPNIFDQLRESFYRALNGGTGKAAA
jgi:hypothetical protein